MLTVALADDVDREGNSNGTGPSMEEAMADPLDQLVPLLPFVSRPTFECLKHTVDNNPVVESVVLSLSTGQLLTPSHTLELLRLRYLSPTHVSGKDVTAGWTGFNLLVALLRQTDRSPRPHWITEGDKAGSKEADQQALQELDLWVKAFVRAFESIAGPVADLGHGEMPDLDAMVTQTAPRKRRRERRKAKQEPAADGSIATQQQQHPVAAQQLVHPKHEDGFSSADADLYHDRTEFDPGLGMPYAISSSAAHFSQAQDLKDHLLSAGASDVSTSSRRASHGNGDGRSRSHDALGGGVGTSSMGSGSVPPQAPAQQSSDSKPKRKRSRRSRSVQTAPPVNPALNPDSSVYCIRGLVIDAIRNAPENADGGLSMKEIIDIIAPEWDRLKGPDKAKKETTWRTTLTNLFADDVNARFFTKKKLEPKVADVDKSTAKPLQHGKGATTYVYQLNAALLPISPSVTTTQLVAHQLAGMLPSPEQHNKSRSSPDDRGSTSPEAARQGTPSMPPVAMQAPSLPTAMSAASLMGHQLPPLPNSVGMGGLPPQLMGFTSSDILQPQLALSGYSNPDDSNEEVSSSEEDEEEDGFEDDDLVGDYMEDPYGFGSSAKRRRLDHGLLGGHLNAISSAGQPGSQSQDIQVALGGLGIHR